MASIQKRKNPGGGVSYLAQVRVRPFKPVNRTFPTRAAAKEWGHRHERELQQARQRDSKPLPEMSRLTVAKLAAAFLHEPTTRSLRYFSSLELLLSWWIEAFGSTRIMDLGPVALRDARNRLMPGRAPATVNRYLSAMRAAWNWGRSAGFVPQDSLWPGKLMLTEPRARTRFLSDDELAALLAAAEAESPQLHAAVLVSIGCGVRQSELLRLSWGDISFDREQIRVLLAKNNESRAVWLPKAAANALQTLKRSSVVGQLVFSTDAGAPISKMWLDHRWRVVRAAAKLENFRWHDLRHSCASFLAQNGANLLEIGGVLGHKSASVTRRYAHLVEGAPVTGHTKLDQKLGGGR
jgi:integrase